MCPYGAEVGDGGYRVDRGGRGRPHRRHHDRDITQVEAVDPHPELVVGGHLAQLHPEHARALVERGVRVLGADRDVAPRGVAGGDHRGHRRGRRRILDVAVPAVRQPEQLRGPVARQPFELRRRRRGAPQERDRVERGGEHLGEDPRARRGVGEVGEEARVLPVGDAGQQDLVEVPQHRRERLALLRRRGGQARADLARLDLREHRQVADAVEVVGGPLERRAAVFEELLALVGRHRGKGTAPL